MDTDNRRDRRRFLRDGTAALGGTVGLGAFLLSPSSASALDVIAARGVLTGSKPPGAGLGKPGDFYLDTATHRLYGPKQRVRRDRNGWGQPLNLLALRGPEGPPGRPPPYSVMAGAGPPGRSLGANGDFYVDTATAQIYGPKTSGSWRSPTSITGPIAGQPGGLASLNGEGVLPASQVPHSIVAYGADPTGVHDSTKAINDALAAGDAVYAPAGIYLVDGTCDVGAGKTLYGDSWLATRFIRNSTAASMFKIAAGGAVLRDFAIENLNHGATEGAFIDITRPAEYLISQTVTLANIYTNHAFIGIAIENVALDETPTPPIQLENIFQENYKRCGLHLRDAECVTMANFTFAAPRASSGTLGAGAVGILMEGSSGGCVFQNGELFEGECGWYVAGSGKGQNDNRVSNVFADSSEMGSYFFGANDWKFSNCWFAARPAGGCTLRECVCFTFVGCYFGACGTYGCHVNSTCSYLVWTACEFTQNNELGGSHCSVEIEGGARHFMVQGCTGQNTGGGSVAYTVKVMAGASDYYVIADNLFNGTVGPILDEGTGTNKRVEPFPAPIGVGEWEALTASSAVEVGSDVSVAGRVVARSVQLRGYYTVKTGDEIGVGGVLATLPAALRPVHNQNIRMALSGADSPKQADYWGIIVAGTGEIILNPEWPNVNTGETLWLETVMYPLD